MSKDQAAIVPLSRSRSVESTQTRAKPKIPSAPRDLSPEARKKFRSTIKIMLEVGTYEPTDIDQVALYAETWLTWRTATDKIRDTDGIHIAGNGRVTRSPYIPIAEKASVALRQIAKELGLTPASRSRIEKKTEKKADEWNQL